MPKRRANGEGNIRKRKDGRWEGRYTAGYDANGKAITKNVLGKTQAEVKDKLRTAIEDSKKLDPVNAGSYHRQSSSNGLSDVNSLAAILQVHRFLIGQFFSAMQKHILIP